MKTQDNQTGKNSRTYRTSALARVRFHAQFIDYFKGVLSEKLTGALNFTNRSRNSNCAKNLANDK